MAEEILSEGDGTEEDSAPEGNTVLTAENDEDVEDTARVGGDADHDTDEKSKDGVADEDKDGAPADYSEFKLPEGMDMDNEALQAFLPMAIESKLTQEQAQTFVDLQVKAVEKTLKKQADMWTDRVAEWTKAAENDEEYGKGEYDKSIMIARSAMRKIGGPNLAKALEDTGTGNHPEIIRLLYRLGKAIGEDNLDFGGINPGGQKTLAERMYPDQGKSAA